MLFCLTLPTLFLCCSNHGSQSKTWARPFAHSVCEPSHLHTALSWTARTQAMFRWANEAEEQSQKTKKQTNSKRALAQGQGNSKRAKPEPAGTSDYDGLTAGLDGFFGKTQGHRGMRDHAKSTRGVLKKVIPAFHAHHSSTTLGSVLVMHFEGQVDSGPSSVLQHSKHLCLMYCFIMSPVLAYCCCSAQEVCRQQMWLDQHALRLSNRGVPGRGRCGV